MIDDYFSSDPLVLSDSSASSSKRENLLIDRTGAQQDVQLGNKIEPATMLAVMGAVVSLVQAGETSAWRKRVLLEFRQLANSINELRQQIAALGVHISKEIDRGFLEADFRKLMSTIKSYNSNYVGYGDISYAKEHSKRLLLEHELRVLTLLEHQDMSTIVQIGTGLLVHHELMHFAEVPLSVRVEIYRNYHDFFVMSLDDTRADSWSTRVAAWLKEREAGLAEIGNRKPPTLVPSTIVSHNGYQFDVRLATSFANMSWQYTSLDAFVHSVPPPDDDIDRLRTRDSKSRGDHVATSSGGNRCWSVAGPSCSQIFGYAENYQRNIINPFNQRTAEISGGLGTARVRYQRALEGETTAKKFMAMLVELVDDPTLYPPTRPG